MQVKSLVAERRTHGLKARVTFTLIGLLAVLCAIGAAPDFSQVGFSTVNALGDNGTTGGGDSAPVVVHNASEFQRAAERLDIKDKKVREQTPRVILIANDIDLGELKNMTGGTGLKDVGIIRPASHTTIHAAGPGSTIRHGTIEIHGKHNIIIRNLAFRDLWENDPSGDYDKLGWDYVRITRKSGVYSHHVWVDHCDFAKAYDGQLDIVHGSDFVTVSWCKFAGDERGPQKKACLIGHSPGNFNEDKGRLNVTFHHNWFENIDDRAPRARFGNIHLFNNYVNGARYATVSVVGATTLMENCYYRDVLCATRFSHADDTIAKGRGGTMCIVGSINVEPRPAPSVKSSDAIEQERNFKSSVERDEFEFHEPADLLWENRKQLPYPYKLDPAEQVPQILKDHAGVGKLDR
jgi:pectate lyase